VPLDFSRPIASLLTNLYMYAPPEKQIPEEQSDIQRQTVKKTIVPEPLSVSCLSLHRAPFISNLSHHTIVGKSLIQSYYCIKKLACYSIICHLRVCVTLVMASFVITLLFFSHHCYCMDMLHASKG